MRYGKQCVGADDSVDSVGPHRYFALRRDLLLPIAAKVGKNARRNLRFLHLWARYTLCEFVSFYHTFTQAFLFRIVKRIISAPAPLPLNGTEKDIVRLSSGGVWAPRPTADRR